MIFPTSVGNSKYRRSCASLDRGYPSNGGNVQAMHRIEGYGYRAYGHYV
jgi:hypothetical protein